MRVDDFGYHLPSELIAQEPLDRRDATRLMTVDRARGDVDEVPFREIARLFRPGDLLVVNDTRVIAARFFGIKESGGRVEVFLERKLPAEGEQWQCLLRSSKPSRPGTQIFLSGGVTAEVVARGEGDTWCLSFTPVAGFDEWLERTGDMPLPPYIKRSAVEADRERYQTVFARHQGAVAAPTAGLHFTRELLNELRERGVEIATLTLHVGIGTFMPVRVGRVEDHRMHRERYVIPAGTADAVNARKRGGGRVVALGTTVCRTLEHAACDDGNVTAGSGETDIFIYPGYRFKVVDALITNFHLPKSTLLMLVAAFAGKELLFRAYNEAVVRRFRFFSYGDAMLIS